MTTARTSTAAFSSLGDTACFPPRGDHRFALFRYGFTATITETGTDTSPVLTATTLPACRTIEISDDGELEWRTRALHYPTIRAQHAASHA